MVLKESTSLRVASVECVRAVVPSAVLGEFDFLDDARLDEAL
ncbi:MAG: hypothetical protein SVG88_11140 [Halobacteriales archaeon]|nr:hypothetical protein [Halobacteriales archaeon]